MNRRATALVGAALVLAGCHDLSQINKPVVTNDDAAVEAAPETIPETAPEVCGGVMCGGDCLTDTDTNPTACGATCEKCAAPANAHPTCGAGKCGWACDDQYFRQGDACVPIPTSCKGLKVSCGPTHDDSCCSYDLVQGGNFSRGYDASDTKMQGTVNILGWQAVGTANAYVDDFSLDRYEVTIGRFRPFLAVYDEWRKNNPDNGAGGHPKNPAGGWLRAWNTRTDLYAASGADFRNQVKTRGCFTKTLDWLDDPTGANDQKPMSCVSWYEAFMFCVWDGARLPTEAEWHFAASAGQQQRAYPWAPPSSLDVTNRANVEKGNGDHFVLDVGSLPDGKSMYGQFDLAGNVAEFVYDTVDDPGMYDKTMMSNPLVTNLTDRLVRGGSYKYPAGNARNVYRTRAANLSSGRYSDTGWRCARPAAITPHN